MQSNKKISKGSKHIQSAGESFKVMVKSIEKISSIMSSTVDDTLTQKSRFKQVNVRLNQAEAAAISNKENIIKIKNSSKSLQEMSRQMNDNLKNFKFSNFENKNIKKKRTKNNAINVGVSNNRVLSFKCFCFCLLYTGENIENVV